MNGKKAKLIRHQAEKLTTGMPMENRQMKRHENAWVGTISHSPKSTRGFYRRLKKELKRGR